MRRKLSTTPGYTGTPRQPHDGDRAGSQASAGPGPFTGFSSLELMLVVATIGVLTAFALPSYNGYVDATQVGKAITDMGSIEAAIRRYQRANDNALPPDLATLALPNPLDPWGHPYQYRPIDASTRRDQLRRDRHEVPLNSDYDLYSRGEDGSTDFSLTAMTSQDDVIRASNGRYVGPADTY